MSDLKINTVENYKDDKKKVTFDLVIGMAVMKGHIILDSNDIRVINGNYKSINSYILQHIMNFICE